MGRLEITQDFHTHTFYSDGHNSIEDNVKRAVELGLKTIGISDHGFNHSLSGIKRTDVAVMRAEIERLKKIYDIEILLGVEANLLNLRGEIDLTPDEIKLFDYVIFGVHKIVKVKKIHDLFTFYLRGVLFNTKKFREKLAHSYEMAMDKYPVKYVVHPNYAMRVDTFALAQACEKHNIPMELNGKAVRFEPEEMQKILSTGVKFIIGSDAHWSKDVGRTHRQMAFVEQNNIPLDRIINIKH